MIIRYRYDKDADALDIRLREDGDAIAARTVEIDSGTMVDLDEHGAAISIEVLRPARPWPLTEILERFTIDEEQADLLRGLWSEGRYPFADSAELGAAADAGSFVPA